MKVSRRHFLKSAGIVSTLWLLDHKSALPQSECKFPLGACDWSLWTEGPTALELAKSIGLNGVEISAGKPTDKLAISDTVLIQQYKEKMRETGVLIPSIAMALLNDAPFATDPRAVGWLMDTIDSAKDLGSNVILLAFFGKGDLRDKGKIKQDEVSEVVSRLKEPSAKAKEKGIILGLENTLSADENLDILNRIDNDACRIYYDIGNSTYNGYDVPAEIRKLRDKICQFHFKDGAFYLGKGKVKMEPVKEAILEIGYKGWIILETGLPTMNKVKDFKVNADYVCNLFKV
ncbi:MAG: sugar phosphate isomerase/epimerase [Candidatus Hydrogenedentes bacterium]|nr:sugar phosphate isomerase/epimerase [Candidatus Hydrogenedentota bacterium]